MKDRIISLDILRGVAVLGILIMNIQSFSMPSAAYINPTAYGDLNGLNKWVWILSHMLANGKFMAIFSMLFGAGVFIFTENAIAKGRNSASLHYRRMGWLLLAGLMHGYLLWTGDILVSYSLCGMLLFVFRGLPPKKLIWIALGFFMVPIAVDILITWSIPYWPEEAIANTMQSWKPDSATISHHLEGYRGRWFEQMELRFHGTVFMQTSLFLMGVFWRVTALMLFGMALFKWGVFSAERSTGFYIRMVLIGLVVGYALSGLGMALNFKQQWTMEYSLFIGSKFNYIGSVGVALGYVGLVMLICKSAGFLFFKKIIAPVGKMAFTNYILQTVICTAIFYGHGLGLYGSVERSGQILFIAGIWILLMAFSPLWLNWFRFGPLEWLWRSLTYRHWQPFSSRV